jgi:GT2 family glycosyltransferase
MRVIATIVTWNSMRYLPAALESLAEQTHQDLHVVIVDNASDDGVEAFVRERFPRAVFLRNVKNLGFGRGQNQAIAYARARLAKDGADAIVLTVNPDVALEPEYVARIARAMEGRPRIGSATGKVLRATESRDGEFRDMVRSDVIDAAGLRIYRSRRVAERGAGEKDDGATGREEEVFGVSVAAGAYRLSALEDVIDGTEYFDEHFSAYKEDADLAWRLRLRGWSALYVPTAVAYRHRPSALAERASFLAVAGDHRRRSSKTNRLSYRNHLLTIVKNEHLRNAVMNSPFIAWYEFRKAAYMALTQPLTFFAALGDFFRLLPVALAKRRRIMSRVQVQPKAIREWLA